MSSSFESVSKPNTIKSRVSIFKVISELPEVVFEVLELCKTVFSELVFELFLLTNWSYLV